MPMPLSSTPPNPNQDAKVTFIATEGLPTSGPIPNKVNVKYYRQHVDVKIDALTKIQAGINDPDALINVLKACLRTSNQHLTTATLSALPMILPLLILRPLNAPPSRNGQSLVHSSTSSSSPSSIVDAFALRQLLNAFLPTGGIFERLGDHQRL
ncbi:hypothetical protein BT96DRAFT_1008251 [Gymnopus androsaceus JB14]|uniref:Uncharacterized protein n=1 Tax=Gymnopus androsaceus JB14 TaxID=1447944 RepID=A0A6A4GFU1_9AGAR|nr:hypothetical protein BT96DRAFT_1008251 [Gymnopus androsaceus JB14]